MSLHKADIEIRKILVKCEEEGDNFDVTLNKVSRVKVYDVVLFYFLYFLPYLYPFKSPHQLLEM